MKFLECMLCGGEVDLVGNDRQVNRKVRCRKCGFANSADSHKGPEVVVIRKRPPTNQ